MVLEVEKVAILYEKPSQVSSDELDLVKVAKFLKRLSKTVSCTIFTTQEFCDEKTTTATSKKWTKVVMFVRNADTMKETVANVRKSLDAEAAVEMKIVVTAPKLAAPRGEVIRYTFGEGRCRLVLALDSLNSADSLFYGCESLEKVVDLFPYIKSIAVTVLSTSLCRVAKDWYPHILSAACASRLRQLPTRLVPKDYLCYRCESFKEVSDWYPQIFVFLFEREQLRDCLAVFMFNQEVEIEAKWFEKVKEVCAKFNKTCVWTGERPRVTSDDQPVDTLVLVSGGEGHEVLSQHNNNAHLLAMAAFETINFLVFTNTKHGKAVRAAKEYRDKFECPDPTIYSSLEMDYIAWTSLLQKMSVIDCTDVSEDRAVFQIIGIVLLAILLFPVFVVLFVLLCAAFILRPSSVVRVAAEG